MKKLLVVGDISIDRYVSLKREFVGGCGFNVAANLAELGVDISLLAPLGEDHYNSVLLEAAARRGITLIPAVRKQPNITLDITNHASGEKSFGAYEDTLLKGFVWHEKEIGAIENYGLIVSPYFEEIRPLIDPMVEITGEKIILDLQDFRGMTTEGFESLAEKVKMLHVGTPFGGREYFRELTVQKQTIISVTDGVRGSGIYSEDFGLWRTPNRIITNVVDSTGAGDRYLSCLIVEYFLRRRSPSECIDLASEFAAQVLGVIGATKDTEIHRDDRL